MSKRHHSEPPRDRGEARRAAHSAKASEPHAPREPQVADVAHVLPDAIRRESEHGDRLARSLASPVEGAVRESARRDPRVLADALAPIVGSALRKSFRASLASCVERSSRVIEHTFSPRSLGWRIQAWRTDRTFAEIVLLKRLVYRVEQVQLLRTDSGSPIQQVTHPELVAQASELAAGRRPALDDFVRNAFATRGGDAPEHVEAGDETLELVRGPRLSLAARVRGQPPRELRKRLQTLLETLHARFAELERERASDASIAAELEPLLVTALETEEREHVRKSRTPLVFTALVITALLLLIVWGGVTRARRAERFELISNVLRTEPGYVVIVAERDGDRMSFEGLRDPLARPTEELALAAGLELESATFTFEPYASLDAPIAARRLLAALAPPPGVDATIVDDRVALTGRASHAWIVLARSLATALADATRLDERGLVDRELEALQKAVAALDGRVTWGASGPTSSDSTHRSALETLRAELEQLDALARAADRDVEVHVLTKGPPTPDELAAALERSRLERCKLHCEDAAAAIARTGKTLPVTAGSFGITLSIVGESPKR